MKVYVVVDDASADAEVYSTLDKARKVAHDLFIKEREVL